MFHVIPDAHAILRKNGVYYQAGVYRQGVRLFVKHGSGFANIYKQGGTSVPKLHIDELIIPPEINHGPDQYGRLVIRNS